MNVLKTLLPAAVLAAGLAVSAQASAATMITVASSLDGGATMTTRGSGATFASTGSFSAGVFEVNSITASFGPLPDLLNSTSLDTSANGSGALDIFVTITGLTHAEDAGGFLSSFTENRLTNGWSVTESTFLDNGNVAFGRTTPLATHTFTTNDTNVAFNAAVPSATYSVTEQFHIVAGAAGGSSLSTIDVAGIPEPTTWGLMIVGFGGIGAMVRNRRRQAVAATA